MSYGAFVKLEDGVEGLVHISEMSWTQAHQPPERARQDRRRGRGRRPRHQQGEAGDLARHEAGRGESLGHGRASTTRSAPSSRARVRNLTTYGAFIEIEEGIDGPAARLRHVRGRRRSPSRRGRRRRATRCVASILSVDSEKKRIALGLKQLAADPWQDDDPRQLSRGRSASAGYVTKITNFGAFVQLEDDLEGLIHITELADHKINSPDEVVKLGMKVEARVIKVDTEERKLGLSFVHGDFEENEETKRSSARKRSSGARKRSAARSRSRRARSARRRNASAPRRPSARRRSPGPTARRDEGGRDPRLVDHREGGERRGRAGHQLTARSAPFRDSRRRPATAARPCAGAGAPAVSFSLASRKMVIGLAFVSLGSAACAARRAPVDDFASPDAAALRSNPELGSALDRMRGAFEARRRGSGARRARLSARARSRTSLGCVLRPLRGGAERAGARAEPRSLLADRERPRSGDPR